MIDNLAIAISHGLLALAVWKLARSEALDADPGTELARRIGKRTFGKQDVDQRGEADG